MATVDELINHPNFGRLFRESPAFADSFITKYVPSLSGASKASSRLQFSVGSDDKLKISILDDSRPLIQAKDESNASYFNRAVKMAQDDFTRARSYIGNVYDSTQTGSSMNRRLDALSKIHNVDFRVSSVPVRSGTADVLEEYLKGKNGGRDGFLKIDPDVSTMLEAFDKKGNRLSRAKTAQILGYEFEKEKRWGAILNEAEAELTYGDGKQIRVALFSPKDYLSRDMNLISQIKGSAKAINKRQISLRKRGLDIGVQKIGQIEKEIYETITDGASMVTQSGLKRVIGQMREAQEEILREGRLSGETSKQFIDAKRRVKAIEDKISEINAAASEGRSFNTRIINAENVYGTQRVDSIKSEAIAITDEDAKAILRKMNPNITDEEARSIDIITTTNNAETVKRIGDPSKILPSSMTLNSDPLPKTPMSNPLTTSTYGGIINVDDYLSRGLQSQLTQLTEEIKAGKVTPGLRRLMAEMMSTPIDDLVDAAEIARIEESKKFVSRLKTFFDGGGDLSVNPQMTSQLMDQIQQHYFKKAKNKSTYIFNGQSVDALNTRFPLQGGTLAHLESSPMMRRNFSYIEGTGRIGVGLGRMSISGVDAYQTKQAFGGFDFDDSFGSFYQYDSKTKRLMNFTLRDPNAMGEYFIFDADIANDTNMPKAIRDMWKQHEKLMRNLETASKRPGQVKGKYTKGKLENLITDINHLRGQLDSYFQGKEVNVGGEVLQQNFIRNVDYEALFKNGMPMSNGFMGTDESWKTYREFLRYSYRQLDAKNAAAVAEKIKLERLALATKSEAGSFATYVGKTRDGLTYSEYNKFFEMTGDPGAGESIKNAIATGRVSRDELVEKLRYQAETGGTLGRAINQYTIIDTFISSHLDYAGTNNVPPEIKKKLRELLETHKMSRIERETLIDALVKEFDKTTVNKIQNSLAGDATKLATIIKELQEFAAAEGILDADGNAFQVGLDPIQFQSRMLKDQDQVDAFLGVFDGDREAFLLSETDPKAVEARLFAQQRELLESFEPTKAAATDAARQNLSDLIGNDFTPDQRVKAQGIISDYEQSRKIARDLNAEGPGERLLRMLEGGNVPALDEFYSQRAIQMRTLAALEGSSSSDVLAVARVLLNSGSDLGLLEQSIPLSEFGDANVADVFERAKNELKIFNQIQSAEKFQDISSLIPKYSFKTGKIKFSKKADYIIDTTRRNELLAAKLAELVKETTDKAPRKRMNKLIGLLEQTDSTSSVNIPTGISEKLGQLNEAMRATGDQTASTVTGDSSKFATTMRRFRISSFSGTTDAAKALRRGMAAIAVFAGIGITHRIVTGDRSVDDANPYPLIPQGSEYESIANKLNYQQAPVVQNGSMSYKIRAHGVIDPAALSQAMQGVLPQGNTTIYESRAYPMDNTRSSSRSILDERLGR